MSQLLYRFINSEHFSDDPFFSVAYLARYADHIGIHHFLCQKLREFSYPEIEFFLPQLCHLLVSIEETESVALEEFIFELCEKSAHGALLTFWLFQTHLHDLRGNSQTNAFKVCRRIYNRVQHIVFGGGESCKRERLKENVLPVTVLASLLAGSIAMPLLPRFFGPLAIAQARKPSQTGIEPPPRIVRSKTVGAGQTRSKRERPERTLSAEAVAAAAAGGGGGGKSTPTGSAPGTPRTKSPERGSTGGEEGAGSGTSSPSTAKKKSTVRRSFSMSRRSSYQEVLMAPEVPAQSPSLPDLRLPAGARLTNGDSSHGHHNYHHQHHNNHHHHRRPAAKKEKPTSPAQLSKAKRIHTLRSNYFRNETQFLSALEDISNRLVQVPKPARLSALRAELALLNNDLPTEVDIPMICPASIDFGGRTSHHRVVRINPAEATVLNSAERVPYLIMVEILRDDFDFDPNSGENEALLTKILAEDAVGSYRRIFDLSEAAGESYRHTNPAPEVPDSVFEPSQGDIGTSPIMDESLEFPDPNSMTSRSPVTTSHPHLPRLSSGNTTLSMSSIPTPRSSELSYSRSGSPASRRSAGAQSIHHHNHHHRNDGADLSALATHMRTAAHMLAQLEASSSKRPKSEVAAIKARIIASMQNLEEQSFLMEDTAPPPTFDVIMANATAANTSISSSGNQSGSSTPGEINQGSSAPQPNNTAAGEARMENDRMTSGVERKADRDDPSAATFGEEWTAKRERIRKTSPYGYCANWDLLSVIVKTGADLRQEAFACQLISIIGKIWERAGVEVWVKRMRILVTGDSSGLVETITNGTSLHSLKRSLTMAAAAKSASTSPNAKPATKIASLKDHFVKTFGPPSSPSYLAAVDAFTRSCAGYSIISYILQLKDRHNGNLLIDNQGHIIHIDFGFMLSNVPGGVTFESAPFKLTPEFLELLDLPLYRELCKKAFLALRKSADNLVMLVELMGRGSKMPCFGSGVQYVVRELRARFVGGLSEAEAELYVDGLIQKSAGSYFTKMYDQFQYLSQGIY
ncbi:hypothetical protein EX30DRAFT_356466 [Ascodesmis nigricans]|uniref:1-phosphatidylinositol 4-kinase n=1 Tax=Ascodesmis nigricans TaxID=341454 RepID=A0A4S2MR00_9PEZI|nr:hypothetical protein EX30DRAFT_356466 [Ascodesmis nigricans]